MTNMISKIAFPEVKGCTSFDRKTTAWKTIGYLEVTISYKNEYLDQIVMLKEAAIDLTSPHLNVCQPSDSSNCEDQG
jgi:hypothetical protein